MTAFHIAGVPAAVAAAVRQTLLSPEYGHPVVREVARGTGPCRSCLRPFTVGREERMLFTYRPPGTDGAVGAPGPVFIHADACQRYEGGMFPPDLRALSLLFEALGTGGRVLAGRQASGTAVDGVIQALLAEEGTRYLHVRHAEAGCHIARIDRAAE